MQNNTPAQGDTSAFVMTTRDLWDVLEGISAAPCCPVNLEAFQAGNIYGPAQSPAGWLIRVRFKRPDRDSGEAATGRGRWWHVAIGESAESVMRTAWMAMVQIAEHEMREGFLYNGARPMDPHKKLIGGDL